jgi:hypothetical protein
MVAELMQERSLAVPINDAVRPFDGRSLVPRCWASTGLELIALDHCHYRRCGGGRLVSFLAINAARARGRVGGRPPALTPDKLAPTRQMYASRQHTMNAIAEVVGVSPDRTLALEAKSRYGPQAHELRDVPVKQKSVSA